MTLRKVAIVITQYPAVNFVMRAMTYAQQLHRAGIETKVVFDGLGVNWLPALERIPGGKEPKDKKKGHSKWSPDEGTERFVIEAYEALKKSGVNVEVSYTALEKFGWRDEVSAKKIKAVKATPEGGGFDAASHVLEGWQLWFF